MRIPAFLLLFSLFITLLHAEPPVTRTQMHMGTLVSISLPAEHAQEAQAGFELIHEIELALSSYDPEAEVYRLNHGAHLEVSPYTLEALQLSRRYHAQSDGYFDITVGSITKKAFRFGADERVPRSDTLDRAVMGIDGIVLEGNRVRLEPGITVDLGGMGKGYAIDKVAAYFHGKQITAGVIAASGDIRCLDRCRIEIQHPFQDGVLGAFQTTSPDTAISTSGNYRRYVKDSSHNHLIDPKSRRPQQRFASITLVAHLPNSDLDAYATAVSVMPFEKAIAFLKARELGYILVTTAKEVIVSDRIRQMVTNLRLNPL